MTLDARFSMWGPVKRVRGMVPIFHDSKDGLISASKMVNK